MTVGLLPTLAQVRGWQTGYLTESAGRWDAAAAMWEDDFTALARQINRPGGSAWDGAAAEAAQQRAYNDRIAVIGLADRLRTASDVARAGAGEITAARTAVLRGVRAAEATGFLVLQNFSVISPDPERQPLAGLITAELRGSVSVLMAADVRVAGRLTAVAAGLGDTVFPESGSPAAPADQRPTLESVEAANRRLLDELESDYRALPDGRIKRDRLADVAAIRAALDVPDSHLIFLDRPADPSQMIPAATSVGDPFTADHVSVSVPGVGTTTRGSMTDMTREAAGLRSEALRIVAATGMSDSVATVAYLGYQPPLTMDSPETLTDDLAQANAPALIAFLGRLNAAGRPGHTTALFGHSYGSLMSGIALKNGAAGLVDNVVLYGSPGFEATSPAQLGLRNDQFFVMTAPDDLIANPIGRLAPAHGWGADPNAVIGNHYVFTHLETRAGTVDLGVGTPWDLTAARGHSDYVRDATQRMSGYNLATILLNRADLAVRAEP